MYMVFSDYYHQKTEDNDYLETRSIRDDFGKDLFNKTYSEDEWNQDLNFILQCVRFYLSVSQDTVKLLPPMNNIIYRKHKQDMGANFEDWAQVYFHPDSGRLDTFVPRTKAFEDFKQHGGKVQGMTSQKFLKKLEAFALLCPWVESNHRSLSFPTFRHDTLSYCYRLAPACIGFILPPCAIVRLSWA